LGEKMALTDRDLQKISQLLDTKLEEKLEVKFASVRNVIIGFMFKNFLTKQEMNDAIDEKLIPIKKELVLIKDILAEHDRFIRTEFPLLSHRVDENTERIIRIEDVTGIE
jgi:hypothetical protein